MINYLLIDILIVIFPLISNIKWKFKYHHYHKHLFPSIAIVGSSYVIWDIIVTHRGDWWFNSKYLIGVNILGLPIEEILFFVTVPYSCIFIYENLCHFTIEKEVIYSKFFYYLIMTLFFIFGLIYVKQDYTILSLFSCGLFFLVSNTFYSKILKSRNYWLYIIISFIPFIFFNYLLTSLVVVFYNPDAILGIRITTIPLEDFFYNYSMLSFYLLVYVYFKDNWSGKSTHNSYQ